MQSESLTVDGICAFPVLVEITGKSGFIALPGGRAIVTFPGQRVTLTNLDDPSHTYTTAIPGAFHLTFLENDVVRLTGTGRNLFVGFDSGLVLAIGTFSVALDIDGNETEPFGGRGQIIDVCGLLD